jgi:Cu(I)/Ag(I) efflux system membrane protein CusA/SilA
MWTTGAGSEVMRRIAAPMVGGMISSVFLTLIVIPALYALVKEYALMHERHASADGRPLEPARGA